MRKKQNKIIMGPDHYIVKCVKICKIPSTIKSKGISKQNMNKCMLLLVYFTSV